MNFDEALSYLLSLGHETLTIKLGLRNTETLLNALGDPHRDFPSVQIAGTNGKGSTAVMLDSICRAAGIHTGIFTSPHLVSITERIRIDGEQISETDFAALTAQVKTAAEELIKQGRLETPPTFFEHVTAIALLAFREAKVELAILETGLGGRLDSTTAAGADVVAITPVAMDHEEYLGDTLAEIAAEKAAIIRPGVTAVVAPQDEEALDVIVRQARRAGVTPRFVGRTLPDSHGNISIGLLGRHQIVNAATAIALAEALRERGFAITRTEIIRGIETATHAGRLELWEGQAGAGRPAILFDGAHNPAAARALRDYLDEFVAQPITLIFGAMRDKALPEMAATLFPKANELILTGLDNPRGATIQMLMTGVPLTFDQARVRLVSSASEALRIAKVVTPAGGLICVTGSLYLVGAVQQILNESSGVAHGRWGN
ncbi:MAG: dihydrofolate synthase / folylpolyglutamate synthase [Blastocatellia bacterium]|jgi:dihydrofolate synthase/folylpolyglutamate synthase|nr:dihydrofolate synthase / folylpolyglutamate synthase [Blastocatellia bacterium]